MHGSLRADAFALLRQAMKARGVTFAALARELDLSEPTVKRVFAERDCKLSRLNAICEVLDVDAADLFDRAERTEATPEALDAATEAALAGDSDLFAVFILMREDMAPDAIARATGLSDEDVFLYALDLEALGLATVLPGGRVRLHDLRALQLRRDGPLHEAVRKINLDYLSAAFDRPPEETATLIRLSRQMRPDTAQRVRRELDELAARIADWARQDQLMNPPDALRSYKLTSAWGEARFTEWMRIAPHRKRRRAIAKTART